MIFRKKGKLSGKYLYNFEKVSCVSCIFMQEGNEEEEGEMERKREVGEMKTDLLRLIGRDYC